LKVDLESVDKGFSEKAKVYDDYFANHPVLRWARATIRMEVMSRVESPGSILELNAGTGSDAEYFVNQGYRVHATDIAGGMISAINEKIQASKAPERFTVQQVSFTDLDQVTQPPFDLVFSNFGGLNCIPQLDPVAEQLPRLLAPGGYVVWVIMPPFCPWELTNFLRGKFKIASRRLHRDGVIANVEGAQVQTWYFSAKRVRPAFPSGFHLIHKQAISLFCPPSYMDKFPHRYPKITRLLLSLDERLGHYAPFHNWGDFVVYTFRYDPSS